MLQLELFSLSTFTPATDPDPSPEPVATDEPDGPTLAAQPPATLAEAITRLQAHPTLSARRRQDLISGLRAIARITDKPPEAIPATAMALRSIFSESSHASLGVSPETWANLRSLGLAALRHVGGLDIPRPTKRPISPAWDALRDKLPDIKTRAGLSRFMSWCSAAGIEPDHVSEDAFAQYAETLRHGTLVRDPRQIFRTTCVLWNHAVAEIAGWPKLVVAVPDRSRRYAWAWEDFPESFRADTEAFLAHKASPDPFAEDYSRPVKPSTVALRRKQILQMATALALSGVAAPSIKGLASLVAPGNAERILRFFYGRRGDKFGYLHQQAILLKTLARNWARAEEPQIAALTTLAKNLAVKRPGMTEKNRTRLRQFDNPRNVALLVGVGHKVLTELQRANTGSRRDAVRAMLAMAVELLIVAPMRVENLAELQPERHLVINRRGRSVMTHIVISPAETKTEVPFEAELPAHTERLLRLYRREFLPQLAASPTPWLFPSPRGTVRHPIAFSVQIGRFIKRETGLIMNAHLFRHLAVKLVLDANPGEIETARRILGHRSSATTTRNYAELRTAAAFKRYDAIIDDFRDGCPTRLRRRGVASGRMGR